MSKIHLLTSNRETIIGISLGIFLLLLALVQGVLLVPSVLRSYAEIEKAQNKEPIDTQTVNEALKLLNE